MLVVFFGRWKVYFTRVCSERGLYFRKVLSFFISNIFCFSSVGWDEFRGKGNVRFR